MCKANPILLCLHPDFRQNINREVRRSLTWHSSESESALERFEPVAVVQQLPDGRGTLFAPVAARRQGERFQREWKALFDDFWYFWSRKSTIKEKFLYVKDNTSSTAIAVPLLPLEKALYPLFLLQYQAQKKKLSKRSAIQAFALCGARRGLRVLDRAAFPKRRAKTLIMACAHSCALSFASAYISAGTVPLALLLVSISSAA